MGFPTITGTILGVPTIRTRVFWGLYWGTPIFEDYHMIHVQNSLKGIYRRLFRGLRWPTIGVIKVDARSLDYSLHAIWFRALWGMKGPKP